MPFMIYKKKRPIWTQDGSIRVQQALFGGCKNVVKIGKNDIIVCFIVSRGAD